MFSRLGLGHLVLSLAIVASLVAFANTFYSAYRVQRDILISNALEANRVYAAKLAESTANFVKAAQQQLAVSAALMRERRLSQAELESEADRLLRQTDSFNSVLIVDAHGIVRAASPARLKLNGRHLISEGAREVLKARAPHISQAYLSTAGNLVVNISQPILSRDGEYLGYVAGTVYLKEKSILHTLLGEHYYRDGSYLYVVDCHGRILYHPDAKRIGATISSNPAIRAVIGGEAGSKHVVNSEGIEMLTGYAPIPAAGWGVVAQRPTSATLAEMDKLTLAVLENTLPATLLLLIAIWYLARLISAPLRQLAEGTKQKDAATAARSIGKIRPWYFEATQLKQTILEGLSLIEQQIDALSEAATTDPMTGLSNRRGLAAKLQNWSAAGKNFSVIALDVDHFKRVNDTYGHDAGDKVICHIAKLMRECSRKGDFLCRTGGEEYLMLLPNCSTSATHQIAERLRRRTETTPTPGVCAVTISLGIASWPDSSTNTEKALALADAALYAAKNQGRNRTVMDATIAGHRDKHSLEAAATTE